MARVESHPKLNTVPPLLFRLVSALIVRENRVYDPNLCSQFFGCAISDVHIVQSINGSFSIWANLIRTLCSLLTVSPSHLITLIGKPCEIDGFPKNTLFNTFSSCFRGCRVDGIEVIKWPITD